MFGIFLIRQACQVFDAIRQVDGDQSVTGFGLLASSDTQLLLTSFFSQYL